MNGILDVTTGKILRGEFLKSMNISAYMLAKDSEVPSTRVTEILQAEEE